MQNKRLESSLFDKFSTIQWQSHCEFSWPQVVNQSAVCEQGSMTAYLQQFCQQIQVEALDNELRQGSELSSAESDLLQLENPANASCLLRQVVLFGDQKPWLCGYTLIPQDSESSSQVNFAKQGNIPLGRTAFQHQGTERDSLVFALVEHQGRQLIARRSRIWVKQTPLLVAEIFLPGSPIYQKDVLK
ncbi:MAG: chorismate--pyruvate lyase family protein [Vibrio sp.]